VISQLARQFAENRPSVPSMMISPVISGGDTGSDCIGTAVRQRAVSIKAGKAPAPLTLS
jgi:NADPH-dependent glutamate synthase beta subunit-like oxidoreductase